MKSRTPTKAELQWMGEVSSQGCIICAIYLGVYSPAEIHHLDGKTKKGAHLRSIPLCTRHHRQPGNGYVSRADGKKPLSGHTARKHGY